MMTSSGMDTASPPTANARRFRNALILVITVPSIFCGGVYTRWFQPLCEFCNFLQLPNIFCALPNGFNDFNPNFEKDTLYAHKTWERARLACGRTEKTDCDGSSDSVSPHASRARLQNECASFRISVLGFAFPGSAHPDAAGPSSPLNQTY